MIVVERGFGCDFWTCLSIFLSSKLNFFLHNSWWLLRSPWQLAIHLQQLPFLWHKIISSSVLSISIKNCTLQLQMPVCKFAQQKLMVDKNLVQPMTHFHVIYEARWIHDHCLLWVPKKWRITDTHYWGNLNISLILTLQ